MQVRPSTTLDFGICSLVTSGLVAAEHILISRSLDYASYWWMNRMAPHESDAGLHILFYLLPLPAVLAGIWPIRRLAWFPAIGVICLVVHALLRLVDEGTGLFISSIAAPSETYWLAPAITYGAIAGVGSALGIVVATRIERWTTRAPQSGAG